MDVRLDVFDIVLYLATSGMTKADNPANIATFYKGHVVQGVGFRCQRNHPDLAILKPPVYPDQRSFPVKLGCHRQRDPVFTAVPLVFGGIELNLHGFNVATLKKLVNQLRLG